MQQWLEEAEMGAGMSGRVVGLSAGDGVGGGGVVAVVVVCDVDGGGASSVCGVGEGCGGWGCDGELLEEVEGALFRERDRCLRGGLGVGGDEGVTRGPVTLVPPSPGFDG